MSAIPIPVPSFNTTLSQPIDIGDTTIYIDSTTDDQGKDLDGRIVGVTVNSGQSNEELIIGTVNTASGALTSCIRDVDFNDGATSNSTGREHDAKSPVKCTSFPYLTLMARMLNGTDVVGGTLKYDPSRTISGAQDLVDKEFAESLTVASFPDFATVDAGGLDVNIQSGTLVTATGTIVFAGSSGVTMTDDATNYVELDENGNVAVNTTGWTEGNVPLSIVITASGDISSISLNRGLITVPISDSTITDDYTFGDTIADRDFVYLDTSDSKWKLADASAEATAIGLIGVALEAGVDTDTGKRVQIAGVVTGLTGLTAGYQYLSDTAGEISSTPGTWRRNVGFAPNATSLVLAPMPTVSQLSGGNSDSTPTNLNEALTFFGNTDMTATEAGTLTSGPTSDAQSLHRHENVHRILGYVTSATADQTITVPAGVLVDDGIIRATFHFYDGGGGGVLNITFGGETIATGLSSVGWYEVIIIQTADDVQSAYVKLGTSDAITASASLTVDTDSDADLVFDVAGGGTKTLTSLIVECMYTIS